MVADSNNKFSFDNSRVGKKLSDNDRFETNTTKRCNRLVIWPRGSLLFGTSQLSAVPMDRTDSGSAKTTGHLKEWDSVSLALRFLYYHFFHERSRIVRFDDWKKIARQKMRFADEFSSAVFLAAQCALPFDETCNLISSKSTSQTPASSQPSADLLALVSIIALLGCRRKDSTDIVDFLRKNMARICWLLLLCHYDLAESHILSPKFLDHEFLLTDTSINDLQIPMKSLSQLDLIFEGTLLDPNKNKIDKSVSLSTSANVIPQLCSSLVCKLHNNRIGRRNIKLEIADQIKFGDLVHLLNAALQNDMFLLDVNNSIISTPMKQIPIKSVRTITSTQLAEHRKITVRNWHHMELLTNPIYAASNLRLVNCKHQSSTVFHLRWLRTAAIADCSSIGPIILGPVKDLLVLHRVVNVTISAICKRVWLVDCQNVRLFLNTKTNPIIISSIEGQNSGIELAPYNVFYDGLFYELRKAEMELLEWKSNAWDMAMEIDSINCRTVRDKNNCSENPANILPVSCSLLKPQNFYVQPTPFRQTETSSFYKTFLSTIPPNYWEEWTKQARPMAINVANQIALKHTNSEGNVQNENSKNYIKDLMPFSNTDLNYLLRRVEGKR
ncbi:tubulin binding cofactor C domain-containing protein [Ditylenchus destructor]|uniref:Tubulin binding cofactor C domain-containing protein n=1 Tax=Ditylenchus destructor TaxID=166010 RepID=A0AAD4MZ19_9BILA|nr:tubulin binding cofactor C domain-containing protein [Ditylenchus destructor]